MPIVEVWCWGFRFNVWGLDFKFMLQGLARYSHTYDSLMCDINAHTNSINTHEYLYDYPPSTCFFIQAPTTPTLSFGECRRKWGTGQQYIELLLLNSCLYLRCTDRVKRDPYMYKKRPINFKSHIELLMRNSCSSLQYADSVKREIIYIKKKISMHERQQYIKLLLQNSFLYLRYAECVKRDP